MPASEKVAALSAPESDSPRGLTEAEVASSIASAVAESERLWALAAEEQSNQARKQITAALEAFAVERLRHQRVVENEAVQLAFAIARKILEFEARVDPHLLLRLVQKALDRVGSGSNVRLRVAPQDAAQWQKSIENSELLPTYKIESDPSLAAGACVVETDLGHANLGFEDQLKELENSIAPFLETIPTQSVDLAASAERSKQESEGDDLTLAGEAA